MFWTHGADAFVTGCCPLCVNIFTKIDLFLETAYWVLYKLDTNDPWVVPYQICLNDYSVCDSRSQGQKRGNQIMSLGSIWPIPRAHHFNRALNREHFKNIFVWNLYWVKLSTLPHFSLETKGLLASGEWLEPTGSSCLVFS